MLAIEAELSPTRFAEVGRPHGAYQRADGEVVALVSDFDRLYWPGRALYDGQRFRHRISLYAADRRRRLGVFDGARFPINDVAFHPSRPVIAVASGAYDGGYLFEGELLLWNWETEDSTRVLSESREVTRVRFGNDGALAVLLRPRHEEEYDQDVFETFLGGTLSDLRGFRDLGLRAGDPDPRIAGFAPCDPVALQFDRGVFNSEDHVAHWQALLDVADFERRHRVGDIGWTDADHVVAVHDGCHVEIWNRNGTRAADVRGDGNGVQVLQTASATFVHVIVRANGASGAADRSTLLELQGNVLAPLASFDGIFLVSVDRAGRFLFRDTDHSRSRKRTDRVIDADGQVVLARDLGHYDSFNHYLRLDGGDALYFLRGTPPTSHEGKVLCRVDGSGHVDECFRWDSEPGHMMCGTACFLLNGAIARACKIYDPNPRGSSCFIEVVDLETGRPRWTRETNAPATCLTSCDLGVLYALTDGRIGVLDVDTGQVLCEDMLDVDGVASVALSMAAKGSRLACGTLDGRVLVLRLDDAI